MMFEVGSGGDGKGMEAMLEAALLGANNSSTLACGVFTDRMEFRKSGECAWNRALVRIQDMNHHDKFVGDIWKTFCGGRGN